jgi:AcrR family transcriptional regulator
MAESKPLRRDAELNRTRILEAARDVFATRGFDATLHDVAARAGVGVGTVYRRYPNKDALIDELFAERVGEIVAAAEQALEAPDPWDGLVEFLERSNALVSTNLGLKAIVLGSPRGEERVAATREQIAPLVEKLVARAQTNGALRADLDPSDMALVQLMLGAVIDATGDSRPDIWRRALALLLDGLRTERDRPSDLPVPPLRDSEVDAAISARPPRGDAG